MGITLQPLLLAAGCLFDQSGLQAPDASRHDGAASWRDAAVPPDGHADATPPPPDAARTDAGPACGDGVRQGTTDGFWSEVVSNASSPVVDTWMKVTVVMVGTSLRVLVDDVPIVPSSGGYDMGPRLASGTVGFRVWRVPSDQAWWIDDVRVRKATDPEPVTTLGPEVCATIQ